MNVSRRRVRTTPGASLGVPVEELVRLIRGRYEPDILICLGKADRLRFAQLRRVIPGVSDRALARQLDELERDGLVERTVYPEVPPRVEWAVGAQVRAPRTGGGPREKRSGSRLHRPSRSVQLDGIEPGARDLPRTQCSGSPATPEHLP